MTRTQVNRKLRQVYFAISLVLLISLVAALAPFIPGIPKVLSDMSGKVYELMRDMSLLIATLAAAYLANVFQKRSTFVAALEREWRGIVSTKSTLYSYCERTDPSDSEYLTAYCRISDTIDNMRIVYKNAGETDRLIGLYPYAPLHDMRRALQSIDPRRTSHLSDADRRLVQDAILQSFFALRETFLEELDLERPRHPLLISGGHRLKKPGAAAWAQAEQKRQRRILDKEPDMRPDVDALLARLYEAEKITDAARYQRSPTATAVPTFPGPEVAPGQGQARGPEV
ncbi:MAG: hypothetical protein KDJ37_12715 [Hyphomicrobiaceae bacterium]|nr:hypothetical protein [Hyphomicrobiaceae bacterium]